MPLETHPEDRFAPEPFFARARARLADPSAAPLGDYLMRTRWQPPPEMRFRDAAVLIPVVARQPQATVILTQRTPHLSSHAGQVAFPGGKIDPTDADAVAAALREAEEEIGLDPSLVEPIGILDASRTGMGYNIIPVLARVAPGFVLRPNPVEVDAVFEVPLAFLMNPENHILKSRLREGFPYEFFEMPLFEERRIWGATAGIIQTLYGRVFG